jgi:hypothetical protein
MNEPAGRASGLNSPYHMASFLGGYRECGDDSPGLKNSHCKQRPMCSKLISGSVNLRFVQIYQVERGAIIAGRLFPRRSLNGIWRGGEDSRPRVVRCRVVSPRDSCLVIDWY